MNKNQRGATILTAVLAAVVIFFMWVSLSLLLDIDAKLDNLTEQSTNQQTVTAIPEIGPAAEVTPEDTIPETTPTTTPEPESEATPKTETEPQAPELDPYEVELIGRTIWGEAGGVASKAERAAVAWCILNRVDARGQSIEYVVTKPYQFQGYRPNGVCPQEHLDLAADVLTRWKAEKEGATDVGRVLPADYLYFMGDGERNHFTTEYKGTNYWDWSLTDPYK